MIISAFSATTIPENGIPHVKLNLLNNVKMKPLLYKQRIIVVYKPSSSSRSDATVEASARQRNVHKCRFRV